MGYNPSCVSLGKPLSLSKLGFLHWQKQGCSWGYCEDVAHLAQCPHFISSL